MPFSFLSQVELTDAILRSAMRHLNTVYRPKPPKKILNTLQRFLIVCELLSTERAYVETLENLRIYRDRASELTRQHRGASNSNNNNNSSNINGGGGGGAQSPQQPQPNAGLTQGDVDAMFREVEQLYVHTGVDVVVVCVVFSFLVVCGKRWDGRDGWMAFGRLFVGGGRVLGDSQCIDRLTHAYAGGRG